MSENKRFYWLKLKDDFFGQREVKKLRKIAGGDTYTVIYLKLQLLSLRNEGLLYFEGIEDSFIEEMALAIDEDEDNVRFTIMFLQKYGLIEEIKNNEFLLPKTVKSIGSETSAAERVRKHRETKSLLQCNTGVTNCNTEKREEKREEIEKRDKRQEKDKKNRFYTKPFAAYTKNPDLLSAIDEFVKMRKSIKAPMTDRAIELMLKKLDSLASTDEIKIDILNQSIANSWRGIFELKGGKNGNGTYQKFGRNSQTTIDKRRGTKDEYPEESLPDFLEK